MIKSHDVGTIQYIEWLILIYRVQPSFIAGVELQSEMIARSSLKPPCMVRHAYTLTGPRSGQKLASDRPNLCMHMHNHFWRNIT